MTPASELITHYRSKGLRGVPLREAIERHAAILWGCDPDVAEALSVAPIWSDKTTKGKKR